MVFCNFVKLEMYCITFFNITDVFETFHYDLGSFSLNTNIEIAQTLEMYSHENNKEIQS